MYKNPKAEPRNRSEVRQAKAYAYLPYGGLQLIVNGLSFALLCAFVFFVLMAPANAAAKRVNIVAFGDSLTAGYGLARADGFPSQLERELRKSGHNVIVKNAGVSGDTSGGGLARIDWAVEKTTHLVILELGANDALRGIDPSVTRQNLTKILTLLRKRDVRVLLAGMLAPPNFGRGYRKKFDAIYPDLADKFDVPLYPFFLDGVAARLHLNQRDAIHPNKRGVAVIVEGILPYVEDAIDDLD